MNTSSKTFNYINEIVVSYLHIPNAAVVYIDFIPDSDINIAVEYAQEYNTRNQETIITTTYAFS